MDIEYCYSGNCFQNVDISVSEYKEEYFNDAIMLESDVFYELRKANNILPNKLCDSSQNELDEIRTFFNQNKQSFFFMYNGNELIGNILILNNYIQSLAVAKKYQRQHYGEKLVKYATNYILSKGYKDIVLNVMHGNTKAEMLYQKLGFKKRS